MYLVSRTEGAMEAAIEGVQESGQAEVSIEYGAHTYEDIPREVILALSERFAILYTRLGYVGRYWVRLHVVHHRSKGDAVWLRVIKVASFSLEGVCSFREWGIDLHVKVYVQVPPECEPEVFYDEVAEILSPGYASRVALSGQVKAQKLKLEMPKSYMTMRTAIPAHPPREMLVFLAAVITQRVKKDNAGRFTQDGLVRAIEQASELTGGHVSAMATSSIEPMRRQGYLMPAPGRKFSATRKMSELLRGLEQLEEELSDGMDSVDVVSHSLIEKYCPEKLEAIEARDRKKEELERSLLRLELRLSDQERLRQERTAQVRRSDAKVADLERRIIELNQNLEREKRVQAEAQQALALSSQEELFQLSSEIGRLRREIRKVK